MRRQVMGKSSLEIKNYLRESVKTLPLIVDIALFEDDLLSLRGDRFTFYTSMPWRITLDNRVVCGSTEDAFDSEILYNLTNQNVVDIKTQSKSLTIDPVFFFSNGYIFECFTVRFIEPWTMSTPVGSYYSTPDD